MSTERGEGGQEGLQQEELASVASVLVSALIAAGVLIVVALVVGKTVFALHYFFNRNERGQRVFEAYVKLCGYELRPADSASAEEVEVDQPVASTRSRRTFRHHLTAPLLDFELELVSSDDVRASRQARRHGLLHRAYTHCCGAWGLFLLVVLLILAHVGWLQVSRAKNNDAYQDARVTPPDFPRYMGCGHCKPGNKSDAEISACSEPCYSLGYVKAWETFARNHDYRLVFFPSRPGPDGQPRVNVSAWWLPADTSRLPPGKVPPRIVVMHGLASNNNHCGVQSACYLLRTMGFSCLTPTVRDYGLSGPSSHPRVMSWGYDYQNDLLGAWDYAQSDPDGILGGPLPASQVGIMGFSKGGLVAAIALGLEKRIPGAWIDSAPYTGLYGMIDAYVRRYAGSMTPLIREPVWWAARHFSGLDLDRYKPLQLLSNCTGPPRKVCISQGMLDRVVPISESNNAVNFLSGLLECYEVSAYTPPAVCDGDSHHTFMWQFPDSGRSELCRFWSDVFGQGTASCGLAELPRFQRVSEAQRLPPAPLYTAR